MMIKLREIRDTDIDRINEFCQDKEIQDLIYNMPRPYTRADAEYYVHHLVEPGYTYAICEPDSDLLIGTIAINRSKVKDYEVSIGYWMAKKYRNKGYTTQAAKMILQKILTEMNVRRIYAIHNVCNEASGKVMKKIGMEFEGHLRSYLYDRGEFKDVMMYSYINTSFRYDN